MNNGISTIRPRQIFQLVENRFPQQNVELVITMPPSGIGSLLTLESCLLVALMKIISAKTIFEIGTFNGNTSLLLAANSSKNAQITSLDLPPEEIEDKDENLLNLQNATQNDQYLRQKYKKKGPFYLKRAHPILQSKVKLIFCNSLEFNPVAAGFAGSQDLVFIDGGHDYETIKNDTEKGLQMLKQDGIIVWHDYLSVIHTDVEIYLRQFAMENQVISIGSTMLCVYLQGKYANLLS